MKKKNINLRDQQAVMRLMKNLRGDEYENEHMHQPSSFGETRTRVAGGMVEIPSDTERFSDQD